MKVFTISSGLVELEGAWDCRICRKYFLYSANAISGLNMHGLRTTTFYICCSCFDSRSKRAPSLEVMAYPARVVYSVGTGPHKRAGHIYTATHARCTHGQSDEVWCMARP